MQPLSCDSEAARWFLGRGYAVIASMRRGYGQTGGDWADGLASCATADYFTMGLETAQDIAASVEYAAALPFARPTGMILVGQSAGGWGSIAYDAMPHPRIAALVNMAGGRGGHQRGLPNINCRPEALAAAAGRFARTSGTPMLWIYTENDSYFAPSIAAAMYASYVQNGGKTELHQIGPFDGDGHRLFLGSGGSAIWGPLVERYLAGRPQQ